MKYLIAALLLAVTPIANATSAFTWHTPAPVSGIVYQNVKLYCALKTSSTFSITRLIAASKTSLSVFSSPLSKKKLARINAI